LDQEPVRAVEPRHGGRSDSSSSGHRPFIQRLPAAPKTGPRASQPTFDLTETTWATAATIRSLETQWQNAIKAHDVDAIDKLLAPDFEATSMTGETGSKSRLLREVRKDENVYKSTRVRGMSVKAESPDVAVVTGTATESGTTKDGKSFKTSRRFTDTWRLRKGKWQCVSSKVTAAP
jgi:ketosteroid isomerase-like protein